MNAASELGSVTTHQTGCICTIDFSHPKSNALPSSLLSQLAAVIRAESARKETLVLALKSGGDGAFCAGASFDELCALGDEASATTFFLGFAQVIEAMIASPQPVVTMVHGKTAGGGVGIIAASDYVVAADDVAVKLSEIAIGIGPFVVGPAIERRVGSGALSAMALDGDWRSATWCATHGLFSRTVPRAELLKEFNEAATTLSQRSPQALSAIKKALWEDASELSTTMKERAKVSARLILTEESKAILKKLQGR